MSMVDFYAITERIRPRDYLKTLGWQPTAQGPEWFYGACPVCQRSGRRERTLSVSRNGHGWHCHRCRKGGGVLQLAMHLMGLPIFPAAVALCEAVGIAPPRIAKGAYRRRLRESRPGAATRPLQTETSQVEN